MGPRRRACGRRRDARRGLAARGGEELGVTLGEVGEPLARVVDPAGQGGGLDITIWAVREWTGEPANRAPEEHDDLRWFTLPETAELPLAHRSLRPLLDRVLCPPPGAIG